MMRQFYRTATETPLNEESLVEVQKDLTQQISKYVTTYLASRYPEAHEKLQGALLKHELELQTGVAVSEMISELIATFSNANED